MSRVWPVLLLQGCLAFRPLDDGSVDTSPAKPGHAGQQEGQQTEDSEEGPRDPSTSSIDTSTSPRDTSTSPRDTSTDISLWTFVRVDDCTGLDVFPTTDDDTPDPARCGPDEVGLAAVCWDGYDSGSEALCTYKSVGPEACTGGNNPGRLYVCETR